ncbi:MAG: type II CRISPR-associated endonuclease Cas1 [Planctomycetaceae bacterium]|jgi:CRISPR-associated protein Cas1|nr:type II CRISPR-associated endonuclease Cas1 [Planctomycetaceae bacterium]
MNFLHRISSSFRKGDNKNEKPATLAAAHAKHILDFSEGRCRLREENTQLVIEKEDGSVVSIPFAEIAVILLSNANVSVTQSVMQSIAEFGGMLVICDYRHRPVSMMLPMDAYSVPVQRLKLQIEVSQPMLKNAWQQIVKAKIRAQAHCLANDSVKCSLSEAETLRKMAENVKSGDSDNIEAQAAKRYWRALFPEIEFHRNHESNDPLNNRLNYGYTIVRAMTARAVCATGFHPALGIHHCNQRDAFCLADDLMEPFRPLVDQIVRFQFNISKKLETRKLTRELTPRVKEELIYPLTKRFNVNGEKRKLFDIITLLAQSLENFYSKETAELYLPRIEHANGE